MLAPWASLVRCLWCPATFAGRPTPCPLHVEILYNEYQSVAAFAVASLLAILALVTLVIKSVAEWRHEQDMKAAADLPPEQPRAIAAAVVR